jgi:hypothetical protein
MGVSGQHHAPAALYPRGKDPRYPLCGGWVGPRAGLETVARGKILCPYRGSNPDRPVVQPVEIGSHFKVLWWTGFPREVLYVFRVSHSTISLVVPQVCNALNEELKECIMREIYLFH